MQPIQAGHRTVGNQFKFNPNTQKQSLSRLMQDEDKSQVSKFRKESDYFEWSNSELPEAKGEKIVMQ